MTDVSGQYGLALHTTTPELGLALDNFAGDTRHLVLDVGRALAGELHLQLADFLKPQRWQDLKFIAVAKGPGGFTGTRMGVVVARTLAQQLNLPLFAISTLAAYAESYWANGQVSRIHPIAVQMKAQRGQIFTALYRSQPQTIAQDTCNQMSESHLSISLPQSIWTDQVMAPDVWETQLAQYGNHQTDPTSSVPPIVLAADSGLAQSVHSLLQIAQNLYLLGERPKWPDATPFYGQHPVTLPASKA